MRSSRAPYVQQRSTRKPEQPPVNRQEAPERFFNLEASSHLLTDNVHFNVIGILGTQGCGKSALANALLGLADPYASSGPKPATTTPPTQRPNSQQDGTGDRAAAAELGFQVRQADCLDKHCTTGINMRVSPLDRTIVLDTQPLFTPCALAALIQHPPAIPSDPANIVSEAAAEARQRGWPGVQPEALQQLQALQLAMFLLSACNLVVVLVEREDCLELWSLLQAAALLVPGVPDVSQHAPPGPAPGGGAAGQAQGQGQTLQSRPAEVVFVLGNQPLGALSPAALRPRHDLLCALFTGSGLSAKQGRINILAELEQQQRQQQQQHKQKQQKQQQRQQEQQQQQQKQELEEGQSQSSLVHDSGSSSSSSGNIGSQVHFWALPDPHQLQHCLASVGGLTYRSGSAPPAEPLKQLAGKLLSQPKQPWGRAATEREWLRGCSRAWAALQVSQELKEYFLGVLRSSAF